MKTILLSVFLLFAPVHKFYVSLSDIRYNTETKTLEIASKLFINDLEYAIEDISLDKDSEEICNSKISNYLTNTMLISVNSEKTNLSFIGYELDDDVIWCYLESNPCEYPKDVDIEFTMLLDEFAKQNNIINFELEGEIKTVFLNQNKIEGEIKWN